MPASVAAASASPDRRTVAFLTATGVGLAAGIALRLSGHETAANVSWSVTAALGLAVAITLALRAVLARRPTVDVIAILALVGALVVGEPLAGAVIAVMLATGQWLEARSQARAERELRLLVSRKPQSARRRRGETVEQIAAGEIARGDDLVIGTGEIVPADGRLVTDAVLDESALTGEPLPVSRAPGETVRSGSVNAGAAFDYVATASETDSSYSGIVRLVEDARADSAPVVRIADRFALAFVPATLAIAGLAWAISGDAVRAVAVLVVATPCPLILAAPIAFIAGMSQSARRGVVVKGGAALEQLAAARVLLLDKTGTITAGRPRLDQVIPAPGGDPDRLLASAAALEALSPHVLASAFVVAARKRALVVPRATDVVEVPGAGISGAVSGVETSLGPIKSLAGPPDWVRRAALHASLDGALTVLMLEAGQPAAVFVFDDPIRLDAARMLRDLRESGITRTVLVTGDRREVADLVGSMVGVDEVRADTDPRDKARIVTEEARFGPTIMLGDGINDAPALATASVGVALASRGNSASSEAARVVMMVDNLDSLADTILIAHRSTRLAVGSAATGMGLSAAAMIAAAVGWLTPVVGAIGQEVIDVIAMLIALAAAIPPARQRPGFAATDAHVVDSIREQHEGLKEMADEVRAAADGLGAGLDATRVRDLVDRLEQEQIPHERAEEKQLYPLAAKALGSADPIAALSRAHAEIERQVRFLRALLDSDPSCTDVIELRRVLYGLYAVIRLHNAQEEEIVFSLRHAPEE